MNYAVTNRRGFIYTGNWTFPSAIVSVLGQNFICNIYVFTNYTEHPQSYRISSYKSRTIYNIKISLAITQKNS